VRGNWICPECLYREEQEKQMLEQKMEAAWSRELFDMLAQDGTWGVPRSGLIFRKAGETLVLIARLPHNMSSPELSGEALREKQQEDVDLITKHFGEAGILVVDESEEGGNA
jgi:hypothetical protein